MATRVWNATVDNFYADADWTPSGAPQAGDTAVIQGGRAIVSARTLDNINVLLYSSPGNSPTLELANAALGLAAGVLLSAGGSDPALKITGTAANYGTINLTSQGAGTDTVSLPGIGAASTLINYGVIGINAKAQFVLLSSAFDTKLTNNGLIYLTSTTQTAGSAFFQVPITGTGTVSLGDGTRVEFVQGVSADQTVQLNKGSGKLQIDAANQFAAKIAGLSSSSTISLVGVSYDSYFYQTTGPSSGNLVLSLSGSIIDTVAFAGDYATNSFSLSKAGSLGSFVTTVTGSGQAPQRVAYTDTTTSVSGGDPATYYTGPVNYLQWQYIWSSPDGVAMAGQSDNMFRRGGDGADAIVAHGGSNVIDGGGGSNFLIGATGADGGTDTFFVDGRGGIVTWSSIANFHHGDAATIFGFNDKSTLPAFTVDGATGYTGATIHSELSGTGTGVNGSVTFAGLSVADAQTKLTLTQGHFGTAGQADYLGYLYIAYTG